jgi:phosphotransferase system HPr-like phosphotransfer protein
MDAAKLAGERVDPLDDGARERVITEERFVEVLREAAPQKELFSFFATLPADPARWKKRHCTPVLERSHAFETFLDDYHARSNRRFVYLAELNASVRNFAEVAHVLNHLDVRFSAYDVRFGSADDAHLDRLDSFRADLTRASRFANESIVKLLLALRDEAIGFGLQVPELTPLGGHVPEERGRERLPHDVGHDTADGEGGAVAVILNGFLQLWERVRRLGESLPRSNGPHCVDFVRQHFPETQARNFQAAVHNLQSSYDTFVKPTRAHEEVDGLKRLRGHVSLALHLFEVSNHLIHFYERHESDETRGSTKARIAAIVPPDAVLEQAILFAVRHAVGVLAAAQPLVQKLLPQFVQQRTLDVDVPDGGILHARPLSLIVGVVRKHGKPVEIVIDAESASASSLMGLILFIGRHPEVRKVSFRGDRAPLDDLRRLFESGLGEHGLEKLPTELAYLKQQQ